MAFGNLANYETVKTRKDRFAADHPNGTILAVPREVSSEEAAFTVAVWQDADSYVKGLDALVDVLKSGAQLSDMQALLVMGPHALGTAYEAKWMSGASKTSWTENCEESAIGRALDNLGYHGNGKCSREEILKAKEAETQLPQAQTENPFDDTEMPDYPKLSKVIAAMHGKRGVRELRQVAAHASVLGWSEADLFAWAAKQGVQFGNGLAYTQLEQLRDAIKAERSVGVK